MNRLAILLVLSSACATIAVAQEKSASAPALTEAELELIALNNQLDAAYSKHHAEADRIDDAEKRQAFYLENDPAATYVIKFLEFEKKHHGTHAGLMAARRLVLLGAGGGELNNPRELGRREVLKILPDYAANPVLPEVVRYLDAGNPEKSVEACLRAITKSEAASEATRLYAQLALARWFLNMRDAREFCERRLNEIAHGDAPLYPGEPRQLAEELEANLAADKLEAGVNEAVAMLDAIVKSKSTIRQPAVIFVNENRNLIRIDRDTTQHLPLLTELASGILFKEQHLRIGKDAPELNLQLVDDRPWSLGENRGKAVVIQFSFKGCGPCEEMYPQLKAMKDEFGSKLSILSIMNDEDKSDTVGAVKSGKLTWNVAWDGFRGPITTQWAVQGFPTIYVIGLDGKIAARDLRAEQLRSKVAELVKEAPE